MINRIKEYLEYRKNIKIAKREIVKIGAMVLPTVREVSNKGTDIVKFIMKLTNETKNINGEKLAEIVLHELSVALQIDNSRLIEILTYMASLQPEDIQKILVHSVVDTIPNNDK